MLSLPPSGGTGNKIDPAKLFGEDRYDKIYQELITDGRVEGENVTPNERKEGVKAYRTGKIDFIKFITRIDAVKTQISSPKVSEESKSPVTPLTPKLALSPAVTPAPPEPEPQKEDDGVEDEDIDGIDQKLDDLLDEIRTQGEIEDRQQDKERKDKEKEKRDKKENRLESVKKFLLKPITKVLKPINDIFKKIIDAVVKIVFAKALFKLIDWFSNPENRGKIDAIFRFIKDFWPAIIAGFLLVGAALTGFALIALGKIAIVAGSLILLTSGLAALAKALGFGKKDEPGKEPEIEPGEKPEEPGKEPEEEPEVKTQVAGQDYDPENPTDLQKKALDLKDQINAKGGGKKPEKKPEKEPEKKPEKEPTPPQKMNGGGLVQMLAGGGMADPRLLTGLMPSMVNPRSPRSRYDTSGIDNIPTSGSSIDPRSRYDTSEIDNIPASGVEKKKEIQKMSLIQRLLSKFPGIGSFLQNMVGGDDEDDEDGGGFLGNLFGRKFGGKLFGRNLFGRKDKSDKKDKTAPSLIEQGLNLQGIKLGGGFLGDSLGGKLFGRNLFGRKDKPDKKDNTRASMGTDTVPAMLTPGESVLQVGARERMMSIVGIDPLSFNIGPNANKPKVMRGITYASTGGAIDVEGTGNSIEGTMKMKDASGKQVGKTYGVISGQYSGMNVPQSARSTTRNAPMPDGNYKLVGFQKHGPYPGLPGIGDWSTYIGNGSGSIGSRSGLMLHSDVNSDGTLGCIGVELGGKPGTKAEQEFLKTYEAINPQSIKIALGSGDGDSSQISTVDRTPTADNSPKVAPKIASSPRTSSSSITPSSYPNSTGSQQSTTVIPVNAASASAGGAKAAGSDVPSLGSVDPLNLGTMVIKAILNIGGL